MKTTYCGDTKFVLIKCQDEKNGTCLNPDDCSFKISKPEILKTVEAVMSDRCKELGCVMIPGKQCKECSQYDTSN